MVWNLNKQDRDAAAILAPVRTGKSPFWSAELQLGAIPRPFAGRRFSGPAVPVSRPPSLLAVLLPFLLITSGLTAAKSPLADAVEKSDHETVHALLKKRADD